MGRSGLPLDRMLEWYRKRYEVKDIGHVLFSLSYFADADAQEMPEMLWPAGWDEMKSAIRRWVGAL